MKNYIKRILKKSKKEIIIEAFVCIVLRAILLLNPILYSEAVNSISASSYERAINILIIYIISISIYKLFEYLRQYSFYNVYNKIYKESTNIGLQYTNDNSIFSLSRFSAGEYLNIMSSDIDIICSFITNGIYRIIQLLEFSVIYYAIDIVAVYIFEILRLAVFIYGVYEIAKGRMELGILLVIYSYYQKIIDNFSLVSTLNLEYKNFKISLQRLNKLFEYAKENSENDVTIEEPIGEIEFNHVLYGYRHDPMLSDFSVKVNPKSITAITGKTGSGKTGIFDLLMKMNRQLQGSIMIDGIDISSINDSDYYNLVSIARKSPFFFNCSIKDNLMMVGKSEEEMEEVCKQVGIHDAIMSLEKGYDTVITNDTKLLSSSQKRLLAIARVFLKDTKIFLFDEIIETLDKENRTNIMKILKEKKKNHTIMIISRDKKILKLVDDIVLIDSGILQAIGTHEELSKTNDLYKEIS